MSAQPDRELLDVAARLCGVQTVDLMNVVIRDDGTLVVLLATGQKYTFNPDQLAAQLGADLATYLQGLVAPQRADSPAPVLGAGVSPEPPAPAPAKASKPKKA